MTTNDRDVILAPAETPQNAPKGHSVAPSGISGPLPLDELARLNAERTPGRWDAVTGASGQPFWIEVRNRATIAERSLTYADAAFIAAIANAADDLLAAARERDELSELLHDLNGEKDQSIDQLRADLDAAKARADVAGRQALLDAADAIQALHPGEVKNSVTFLRDRAALLDQTDDERGE